MRAALLLAVLLVACGSFHDPCEVGRYPVTLTVVASLTPSHVGGHAVGARVVSPTDIVILPEYRTSVRLVAHELAHIVQWNRIGWDFPIVYAHQVITFGYWDAPLEIEARAAAVDAWYLAWAWDVIDALEGRLE